MSLSLKQITNLFSQSFLKTLVPCFLCFLIYVVVTQLSFPIFALDAIALRNPYVLILEFLILLYSFSRKNAFEKWISFTLVLILFALPLVYIWNTGESTLGRVGGLLPASDSAGYFRVANIVLDGRSIGLRWVRPLFPSFLSVILGLTQRNIMASQVLITALVATSCFLLSREIKQVWGSLVAVFTLIGTFWFYQGFIGAFMTESLGLALGSLSLAVLLRSATQQKFGLALAGITLLTVAMCARIGAILILPLLLIWGGILFRRTSRFSWFFFLAGGILFVTGLGLNSWIGNYISEGNQESFGNYSYVLYGLLTGGNWRSIFADYPDIATSPKSAQLIYQYCFEIIRQDPMSLVRGILRAFKVLLVQGSFDLLNLTPLWSSKRGLAVVVRVFLLVGLIGCAWRARSIFDRTGNRLHSASNALLLTFIIGTLLSAPLVPYWDAGWRPYTTTIPTLYLLLGLGIYYFLAILSDYLSQRHFYQTLQTRIPFFRPHDAPRLSRFSSRYAAVYESWDMESRVSQFFPISLVLGTVLAFLTFVAPFASKVLPPSWPKVGNPCDESLQRMVVYIHPRSAIYLHPNDQLATDRVPHLRLSTFQKQLNDMGNSQPQLRFLNSIADFLEAGDVVLPSLGGTRFPILNESLMPEKPGHYILCSEQVPIVHPEDLFQQGRFLFDVHSIHIPPG